MVEELDKSVGEVMATVKRLGLSEDTFVFFTSDNGGDYWGWNGPFRCFVDTESHSGNLATGKTSLWEGGIRVPAVAWWPGHIKAGSVSHEVAINLDVLPTVLEMAGIPVPRELKLDGVSILPVLLEGRSLVERELFWEFPRTWYGPHIQQAMRQGPWKLCKNVRGQVGQKTGKGLGLYNLAEDIGEKNNLAQKYPARVREMTAAFENWKKEVTASAVVESGG